VQHVKSGRLRALGVAAPQRVHGALAEVPTWREQGIDAVSANWRGVIGPKGMTAAQIRYWETLFGQLVRTPDWQRDLEVNGRVDEFLGSAETRRYYDEQFKGLQATLIALGLAK